MQTIFQQYTSRDIERFYIDSPDAALPLSVQTQLEALTVALCQQKPATVKKVFSQLPKEWQTKVGTMTVLLQNGHVLPLSVLALLSTTKKKLIKSQEAWKKTVDVLNTLRPHVGGEWGGDWTTPSPHRRTLNWESACVLTLAHSTPWVYSVQSLHEVLTQWAHIKGKPLEWVHPQSQNTVWHGLTLATEQQSISPPHNFYRTPSDEYLQQKKQALDALQRKSEWFLECFPSELLTHPNCDQERPVDWVEARLMRSSWAKTLPYSLPNWPSICRSWTDPATAWKADACPNWYSVKHTQYFDYISGIPFFSYMMAWKGLLPDWSLDPTVLLSKKKKLPQLVPFKSLIGKDKKFFLHFFSSDSLPADQQVLQDLSQFCLKNTSFPPPLSKTSFVPDQWRITSMGCSLHPAVWALFRHTQMGTKQAVSLAKKSFIPAIDQPVGRLKNGEELFWEQALAMLVCAHQKSRTAQKSFLDNPEMFAEILFHVTTNLTFWQELIEPNNVVKLDWNRRSLNGDSLVHHLAIHGTPETLFVFMHWLHQQNALVPSMLMPNPQGHAPLDIMWRRFEKSQASVPGYSYFSNCLVDNKAMLSQLQILAEQIQLNQAAQPAMSSFSPPTVRSRL